MSRHFSAAAEEVRSCFGRQFLPCTSPCWLVAAIERFEGTPDSSASSSKLHLAQQLPHLGKPSLLVRSVIMTACSSYPSSIV